MRTKGFIAALIALFIVGALPMRVNAAVDLWATGTGGSGNDIGYSIASFSDGSSVVAGGYSGTVTFGSTTLTSSGSRDVFVAKINASGQWLWAVTAGTSGQGDVARAVSVLPDGSSVVTGYFRGTMTFPGSSVPNLVSIAQEDVFVAKVSSAGQWVWATKAGSTTSGGAQGSDVGRGIASLSDGSAIVTGYFQGSATFGSFSISSSGDGDVFVASIDSNGTWQWAQAAGGTGDDEGYGAAAYSDNTVVVTGSFDASISFGSLGTMSTVVGGIYVARVDGSGNWSWQNSAVGDGDAKGLAVSTQPDGGAGVAGSFNSTFTFGAAATITAAGSDDIFVAEVNASGEWVWAIPVGDTASDSGVAIAATGDGNYVLAGSYQGTATFGDFTLTSAGVEDAFIAELDRSGTFLWAQTGGGTSMEENRGVTELLDGSFMVVGDFRGTAVFGSTTLVSNGSNDVFIARYADTPRAPRAVTAERRDGELVISWTAPAVDGGAPITSYTATVQPGGATCTAVAPALTCTISGRNAETTYIVTVSATNAAGTGPASAPFVVDPVVPAKFTG